MKCNYGEVKATHDFFFLNSSYYHHILPEVPNFLKNQKKIKNTVQKKKSENLNKFVLFERSRNIFDLISRLSVDVLVN